MSNMTVLELFSSFDKKEIIYYLPNHGNAGDALIAAATYMLLDKAGVNYQIIDPYNFDGAGKTIMYGGGGNLIGIYATASDFIAKHHAKAKHFILLPHTVARNEELLAELGSNVTLFAREQISYDYLLDKAKKANVYLNQDLALYVNPKEILPLSQLSLLACIIKKIFYKITNNKTAYRNTPQPAVMMRYSKFEKPRLLGDRQSANFFRTDDEKALETTPDDNMDLSALYDGETTHKEICLYTVSRLMAFINNFETINTDRLHICIASALLGKKVNFYANSYFKCKAIYEFSLKDKFQSVTWCGGELNALAGTQESNESK